MFDSATQMPTSLVGPNDIITSYYGWYGGALANYGVIYCTPFQFNKVRIIDTRRELSVTTKQSMRLHLKELGCFIDERAE